MINKSKTLQQFKEIEKALQHQRLRKGSPLCKTLHQTDYARLGKVQTRIHKPLIFRNSYSSGLLTKTILKKYYLILLINIRI